jgi:predicted 3-demethylubiquinone-9 3-methyltransferase (glyoxalase superfamily)
LGASGPSFPWRPISVADPKPKEPTMTITPCLWFDTEGEDAAKFYVSIFDNSRVTEVSHYGEAVPDRTGTVLTVAFELDGQPFLALNGGPQYTFTEAISFQVPCPTQRDVDRFWEKLGAGGEPGPCGWLKDRFGVSWQIVPRRSSRPSSAIPTRCGPSGR